MFVHYFPPDTRHARRVCGSRGMDAGQRHCTGDARPDNLPVCGCAVLGRVQYESRSVFRDPTQKKISIVVRILRTLYSRQLTSKLPPPSKTTQRYAFVLLRRRKVQLDGWVALNGWFCCYAKHRQRSIAWGIRCNQCHLQSKGVRTRRAAAATTGSGGIRLHRA